MKDIFSSLYTTSHLSITLGDSKKTAKGHLHHNSYGLSHRCRRHYHASKPSIPRRLSFPLPDIPCRRAAPGTSTPQPSTDSQHCRQTSIYLNAIEYEGFRGSIYFLPWRCRSTQTSPQRPYVLSQPDVSRPAPARRSWTTPPLAVAWPCTGPARGQQRDYPAGRNKY